MRSHSFLLFDTFNFAFICFRSRNVETQSYSNLLVSISTTGIGEGVNVRITFHVHLTTRQFLCRRQAANVDLSGHHTSRSEVSATLTHIPKTGKE